MIRKLSMDDLGRPTLSQFRDSARLPLIIICDNIRSALNIGSIFRTADAFAIESIMLVGISQTPPHKEILKTALGAEKSIPWNYFYQIEEAITQCKTNGYKVIGIEQTTASASLLSYTFDTNDPLALIFGNEVQGISSAALDLCDGWIEIPQAGTKHSFNVAVTAGIVAWEYYRQYQHSKKN